MASVIHLPSCLPGMTTQLNLLRVLVALGLTSKGTVKTFSKLGPGGWMGRNALWQGHQLHIKLTVRSAISGRGDSGSQYLGSFEVAKSTL